MKVVCSREGAGQKLDARKYFGRGGSNSGAQLKSSRLKRADLVCQVLDLSGCRCANSQVEGFGYDQNSVCLHRLPDALVFSP